MIFRESIPFLTLILNVLSIHIGHPFVVQHFLVITIFESSIINPLYTEAQPSISFIVRGKLPSPYATIKLSPHATSVKLLTTLLTNLSWKRRFLCWNRNRYFLYCFEEYKRVSTSKEFKWIIKFFSYWTKPNYFNEWFAMSNSAFWYKVFFPSFLSIFYSRPTQLIYCTICG